MRRSTASVPRGFVNLGSTCPGLEAFACSAHVLRQAGAADPRVDHDYVFL